MNLDQTAPLRSSLNWVDIACNLVYQSTSADLDVDDKTFSFFIKGGKS